MIHDPAAIADPQQPTRRNQMHAESAHDLLAPSDLTHHLPEYHGIKLEDIESRVDVDEWMAEAGIESTGDFDLDLLVMAHEMAHEEDEELDSYADAKAADYSAALRTYNSDRLGAVTIPEDDR